MENYFRSATEQNNKSIFIFKLLVLIFFYGPILTNKLKFTLILKSSAIQYYSTLK